MPNQIKQDTYTQDIPTEDEAFRRHVIGVHKLLHANIREMANRQDEHLRRMMRYERHQERLYRMVASAIKKWARLMRKVRGKK